MRVWSPIARVACILILAAMLGGCGFLASTKPLIAVSDSPLEPLVGNYQVFVAMNAKRRHRLPVPERVACIDPGYSGDAHDKYNRRTGKRERLFYCSFDPDEKKPFPMTQIVRLENGFGWLDEKSKTTSVRLRRIHERVYLMQSPSDESEESGFIYYLLRLLPSGPELFMLLCDDFPSVSKQTSYGVADRAEDHSSHPQRRELREEPKTCEIDSLGEVRTELDAFVARVDADSAAPLILLRPIADH